MNPCFPKRLNGRNSRLYQIHADMKQRCNNPNLKNYKYYGGKGITVCPEWMDYDNFAEWAFFSGYTEKMTIDRIKADGNYCPENCQWIVKAKNSSKAMLGQHHTDTAKQRIGESRIGKKRPCVSGGNHHCARAVLCVETGRIFETERLAATFINRDASCIRSVLSGKTMTSGGYHWKSM